MELRNKFFFETSDNNEESKEISTSDVNYDYNEIKEMEYIQL